jgi:hypothetical protein
MDWQAIIEFLGGSVVFSAAFGYIGKAAVEAYLKGRIAEHKADLDRIATEHSVRFQRLHSERADIIKDLYARLAKLDDALGSALKSFQHAGDMPLVDKVHSLPSLYNDLRDYYVPKRIFFAQDTCSSIDTILDHFREIFFDITAYPVDPTSPEYQANRSALMERRDFWEKARKMHSNEFTAAKSGLEHSFRGLLGIGV